MVRGRRPAEAGRVLLNYCCKFDQPSANRSAVAELATLGVASGSVKLERTQRYRLEAGTDSCSVVAPNGSHHFVAPATQRIPKLYIASRNGAPIYVGITSQSMATRLRFGFRANGKHGYHGYRWRGQSDLDLDIWYLDDVPPATAAAELECIEAEVVFLTRQTFNQWPEFQTEIHFHSSNTFHRDVAARIFQHLKRNA
jgi:hypothetical protein